MAVDTLLAGTGGFGQGALAGRKMGLEQEALNLRRDDMSMQREELGQIGQLRGAQAQQAGLQSDVLRMELKKMQEYEEKKGTPLDINKAFQQQFPMWNPEQVAAGIRMYRRSKPVNDMGSTNVADFEDFVNGLMDEKNREINAPVLREIAKVGVETNKKKIEGFEGDLKKLQDSFSPQAGKKAKVPTSKDMAIMDELQANIDALEKINAVNMSDYDALSKPQEAPPQAGFPPEIQFRLDELAKDIGVIQRSDREPEAKDRLITEVIQEGMRLVTIEQQGKVENYLRPFAEFRFTP